MSEDTNSTSSKGWLDSRTNQVAVVIGSVTTIVGIAYGALSQAQIAGLPSAKWLALAVPILATLFAGLRSITKDEIVTGKWIAPLIGTVMTALTAIMLAVTPGSVTPTAGGIAPIADAVIVDVTASVDVPALLDADAAVVADVVVLVGEVVVVPVVDDLPSVDVPPLVAALPVVE